MDDADAKDMGAAQRNTLIQQAVLDVLRNSNLADMTEFRVRASASHRLGIDLSDLDSRLLVRTTVESFLLSDEVGHGQGDSNASAAAPQVSLVRKEDGELVVCKLAEMRYASLNRVRGTRLLSIRDYYVKDGQHVPSAKGISLTREQWSSLKNNLPSIQNAIEKIHSKLSFQPVNEERKDASDSRTTFVSGIVPLEIRRFDGNNYASWAQQMEFFLNQLDVAYVLADPCPTVTARADATQTDASRLKAAEQKWLNDDFICRRNILSSLSDGLYYKYSENTKTSRDLWQQLRSIYLYEDYKARRSLVKKYLEFQMTDEKPIYRQAKELDDIAYSILESGVPIDERFHVCVIVSKLPASWKDIWLKLARYDDLYFESLMDDLSAEDERRKKRKFKGPRDTPDHQRAVKLGHNTNCAMNPQESPQKRTSDRGRKQVVCFSCMRRGHFSYQCRMKNSDKQGNSSQS